MLLRYARPYVPGGAFDFRPPPYHMSAKRGACLEGNRTKGKGRTRKAADAPWQRNGSRGVASGLARLGRKESTGSPAQCPRFGPKRRKGGPEGRLPPAARERTRAASGRRAVGAARPAYSSSPASSSSSDDSESSDTSPKPRSPKPPSSASSSLRSRW